MLETFFIGELYFTACHADSSAIKIIAMKKAFSKKRNETLAQYYLRTYGHLLNDIQVWEVDEIDNFYKIG